MNILAKRSYCRGGDRRFDNTGPSSKLGFYECCKQSLTQDENAPGILRAKKLGIEHGTDWKVHFTPDLHIIFDVTGNETVFAELLKARPAHTVLIPGSVANLLVRLLTRE